MTQLQLRGQLSYIGETGRCKTQGLTGEAIGIGAVETKFFRETADPPTGGHNSQPKIVVFDSNQAWIRVKTAGLKERCAPNQSCGIYNYISTPKLVEREFIWYGKGASTRFAVHQSNTGVNQSCLSLKFMWQPRIVGVEEPNPFTA